MMVAFNAKLFLYSPSFLTSKSTSIPKAPYFNFSRVFGFKSNGYDGDMSSFRLPSTTSNGHRFLEIEIQFYPLTLKKNYSQS